MTRVIFLNRYFYPDHSATSQLLGDLAFHLAQAGESVVTIASRQIYDAPAEKLAARERVHDVDIIRVWTTRWGRHALAGRLIDYLTFYLSAAMALWRVARRGDVIVVKTDPPLFSILAAWIARRRGAKTVNWLQDLYPEVASALGVTKSAGHFHRLLLRLRNGALNAAALNVVIGEDMAERLKAMGIAPATLRVIHNWSDDEAVTPLEGAQNALRAAWGLEGKFIVGYSGNLGRAHECETLLAAAETLRAYSGIHFLFIGGGRATEALRQRAAESGLDNFSFLPYQPRDTLSLSLAASDVHWLSLRPELDGFVLPSKFYGIAAAGKPVIAVTTPASAFGRMIVTAECGYAIAPGDSAGLAGAILALAEDDDIRRAMGANARHLLETRFTKREALARWRAALSEIR